MADIDFLNSEEGDDSMTKAEFSRLIDYLGKIGWSAAQILELLKYISR